MPLGPVLAPSRVLAARNAVFVLFGLAGTTFATFASRIADTKAALGLTPGELGVTLLAASAGSVAALPSAGRVADRVGAARTIQLGIALGFSGLVVVGVAVDVARARLLVAVGLFLVGVGVGLWDVAMNLEGAAVERLLGKTVMPRFHAAFSGGTVLAALVGAAMSWGHVPLLVHFGAVVLVSRPGRALGAARLPAARDGGRRRRRRHRAPSASLRVRPGWSHAR